MTSMARLAPLAVRHNGGPAGTLRSMRLAPLPPRMIDPAVVAPPARGQRRTRRIWELSHHLHCSIVGTCLSTGELRQVLGKIGPVEPGASDHELHGRGVSLAGRRDGAAKMLHKALDRRHRAAISRFEKAATPDEVRATWREAMKQGDVPGGYWAAMTHPATNDSLIREIFGEVHMLSHLVGAANRADIRRLAALEAENGRLRDKLARQHDQLRDGITSRDARIRELSDMLARRLGEGGGVDAAVTAAESDGSAERAALEGVVADLERRLRAESNRRVALAERVGRLTAALDEEREQRRASERRERTLCNELDAMEAGLTAAPPNDAGQPTPSLAGRSLLYVGGRVDRLGHRRALSEAQGACFLHHDGGVDDRSGLLGGLVSRADLVMFPVDCVSHEAVTIVKRLCRQMSKPYVPLRSSGTGAFLSALARTSSDDAVPSP